MHLKLVALDLDGTLTNDEKVITPKTKEMLMRIQREGVRLALASARPAPGLLSVCDELQMRQYGGILMSYNGGRIVDAASGETLSLTPMDEEETREILRFLEELPVNVILDDGERFYVTDPHAYKVEYECWNNNMTSEKVENLADFLHFPPVKLLMSVDPREIAEVQTQIASNLLPAYTVVKTAPFYLEIIPSVINKGQGLRDVCRVLGFGTECAAAFGDAENDIPMLVEAGFGVAMGNADEAVKAAADYVTASNNEDGVAAALCVIRDSPI